MPDCIRYRKDGENERKGIVPDIPLNWDENHSMDKRGEMVIQEIVKTHHNKK
jgi:hypothetical protein